MEITPSGPSVRTDTTPSVGRVTTSQTEVREWIEHDGARFDVARLKGGHGARFNYHKGREMRAVYITRQKGRGRRSQVFQVVQIEPRD